MYNVIKPMAHNRREQTANEAEISVKKKKTLCP